MEGKWIAICAIGVTAVLFAPLSLMEYGKSQCRITAINAQMPADDILKLCK
jgi:hypothetical protein